MLTNTLFNTLITEYVTTTKTINIDTFDAYLRKLELKDEFHEHNVNKIKGSIFEFITKYYYLFNNFEVYLFNEIPIKLRNILNLGKVDYGIDLIYKDGDNWIPVQSKWRKESQYNKKTVHKDALLGFIEEANRRNFDKKVVFTNVQNTNGYIEKVYDLDWILRKDLTQIINKNFMKFIINDMQIEETVEISTQIKLRGYQYEALAALLQPMKHRYDNLVTILQSGDYHSDELGALLQPNKNDRKQCIMYCGTGKSMVMCRYIHVKKANNVIVFMPSLQLISQFYNTLKNDMKYNKYITDNILCICSSFDVKPDYGECIKDISYTTDVNVIKQQMANGRIIILCTYQSSKLVKNLKFDLGIFDEAHKTVNNDTYGFALDNNNCKIKERIFFTATPKYYNGDNEECVAMNNESIYGKEVFNYSFQKAKEEKNVLDFQIITYVVPKHMEDLVNEMYIKKHNLNVPSETVISAIMMAQQISTTDNCKKILTYHNTINNAIEYKKTLEYIFIKFNIDAKIFVIWGDTKINKRREMIKEFESSKIAIICSSRVLGEGVDIPCTDTVTFVDPRNSSIDVTQCVGRGQRLYGNQKICNVIIPVHYDKVSNKHKFSDLIKILSALSDVDNKLIENFMEKSPNNKIKIVNLGENFMDNCGIDVKYDIDVVMRELRLAISKSNVLSFDYNKDLLFEYCDNKKKPFEGNSVEYKGCNLSNWFYHQKSKLKSIDDDLYKILAENQYVKINLDKKLLKAEENKDLTKITFDEKKASLFEYYDKKNNEQNSEEFKENKIIEQWLVDQKKQIKSNEDEKYKILSENKYVKKSIDNKLEASKNRDGEGKLTYEQGKKLLIDFCEKKKRAPKKDEPGHKRLSNWYFYQKGLITSKDDELYKKLSTIEHIKTNLDKYLIKHNKNKDKVILTHDQMKDLLFKFCDDENNKRTPKETEKDENGQAIGDWLKRQKKNINSTEDVLYKKLSENIYVKNNIDKFLESRNNNKDKVVLGFEQKKIILFNYCDINYEIKKNNNEQLLSNSIKYEGYNIGEWLKKFKENIKKGNKDTYNQLSENKHVKKYLDECIGEK